MLTARSLITFMTDVAIADTGEIADEFGLMPQEADNAAWHADLHWTMGASRDEPVIWQPRHGEDLDANLAAFNGNLDAPLSTAAVAEGTVAAAPAPSDGPVAAEPVLASRVTDLELSEARAYLGSGYNPRLGTSINRIADAAIEVVRDLTVGSGHPKYVTCRAIMNCAEGAPANYRALEGVNYNTVRKIANALGATGRLTRLGGGKGGRWKYGVPA